MPLRIHPTACREPQITISKKTYQDSMLGLLVIFGVSALFSVLAFFLAIIALLR